MQISWRKSGDGDGQLPESAKRKLQKVMSSDVFCAGTLVSISICEAAAIFNSFLYFVMLRINPSDAAGSQELDNSIMLENFTVMVIREFIF
jgi:hypothetical protein